MINVENIFKSFKSGKEITEVLKGVTFSVFEGESVALMGPSGVGKSTLLHLIAGLIKPDSGKIEVAGISTSSFSDEEMDFFRNKTIGFVFQHHYLLSEFTLVENVIIPALVSQKKDVLYGKAFELIKKVGLDERLNHYPNQLSGGEQQRAAIARALINSPKLILADEPTGDLDEQTGNVVFEMFKEIVEREKLTLLIATHNPLIAKKCDRILHLHKGVIKE